MNEAQCFTVSCRVSYSVINIYVLSGCIFQGLCGLLFPSNFAFTFYLTENILIQSFCFTNSLFSCSAVINARVSRFCVGATFPPVREPVITYEHVAGGGFFCSSSLFLIRLQRFRHERTCLQLTAKLRQAVTDVSTMTAAVCVLSYSSHGCQTAAQRWILIFKNGG